MSARPEGGGLEGGGGVSRCGYNGVHPGFLEARHTLGHSSRNDVLGV